MSKPIKAMAFSFVVASVGAVALVSAPACSSGGGVCSATSKCSADPAQTQTQVDQCNKLSSDACGSQYVALGNCALAQQTCTSSNTTDTTAWVAAIQANCASQAAAYSSCCQTNTSACH